MDQYVLNVFHRVARLHGCMFKKLDSKKERKEQRNKKEKIKLDQVFKHAIMQPCNHYGNDSH
jgi:hypothetical protein